MRGLALLLWSRAESNHPFDLSNLQQTASIR